MISGFSKKVARKDTKCLVCDEVIPKGTERYVSVSSHNSLCDKCFNVRQKEGGCLGHISRAKILRQTNN